MTDPDLDTFEADYHTAIIRRQNMGVISSEEADWAHIRVMEYLSEVRDCWVDDPEAEVPEVMATAAAERRATSLSIIARKLGASLLIQPPQPEATVGASVICTFWQNEVTCY